MKNTNYCQSCSMPLDKPELIGTEKDGSQSRDYCKYCYENGAFTNPGMSLAEMKELVIKRMKDMQMDPGIINKAVKSLPNLKRWKGKPVSL